MQDSCVNLTQDSNANLIFKLLFVQLSFLFLKLSVFFLHQVHFRVQTETFILRLSTHAVSLMDSHLTSCVCVCVADSNILFPGMNNKLSAWDLRSSNSLLNTIGCPPTPTPTPKSLSLFLSLSENRTSSFQLLLLVNSWKFQDCQSGSPVSILGRRNM